MPLDKSKGYPILKPILGHARTIPWEMIAPHDRQAKINHDQTLDRLAERGGLGYSEAIAILKDEKWKPLPELEAARELNQMVSEHYNAEAK